MSGRLQSYNKKYYIFCSITGVFMQCSYLFLFFHFDEARIYFGEKPYMYGVNPSDLFVDIIDWIGIVSGAMAAIGILYLLLERKKPWLCSESRKVAWLCTIGGLFFLLYGGYKMFKYHGRELYCDVKPIMNSNGQPYIIDTFLYVPLVVVAVAVLWGASLLWRLYHIKED